MKPREKEIYKVTLAGTAVNAVLIVLKFIAGILGRSSAMVADAVHSLSDFVTDIIVLVFVRISGKPRDKGHDYGHGKFETLATLIIGLILVGAGVGLFVSGLELVIDSLHGHLLPRPTWLALAVAVVSIFSKEILYRYTAATGRRLNSPAVVANAWHHRSDAISSLGTMAGIDGAMFLGDHWRILDPIAAMLVSFFIVKTGYDIVKPCVSELLEGSLPEATEREILDIAMSVKGIHDIHNLRTRRIGSSIAIDLHAGMDGDMPLREAHSLASLAEQRLRSRFGNDTYISIHMEPVKPSPTSPEL